MNIVTKKRVGILTNIPSPYRIPLFNRLAEHPEISLCVAFNSVTEKNRHWKVNGQDFKFDYTFLDVKTISVGWDEAWAIHLNTGIRDWIERNQLETVIIGGWNQPSQIAALLYCKMHKIPVVLWSGSIAGKASRARKVSKPIVRLIVKLCSWFIAYGSEAKKYLVSLGVDSHRISRAFNTVDVEWWGSQSREVDIAAARGELGFSDEFIFAYSGQLIDRKGIVELIQAFSSVHAVRPESRLLIAGSGPQRHPLGELVAQLGLKESVTFLGETRMSELPRLYSIADVTVLPSKYEVWGLVVNESMSCSTAALVSNAIGAGPDLIEEGKTGWTFDVNDPVDLQRRMEHCLSLGRNAVGAVGLNAAVHIAETASINNAVSAMVDAVHLRPDRGGAIFGESVG